MAQKSQSSSSPNGTAPGSAGASARDSADATASSSTRPASTASSALPRMSDPNPPYSQPMTKSSSSGSNSAAKNGAADTAAPYGTRSRNRGQSRPNYAEDKDVDMELYDVYPEKRDGDSKKASRQTNVSGETQEAPAPRAANGATRKPLPSDTKRSPPQGGAKDQPSAPATASAATSSSANPSVASRKRKAPPTSAAGTAGSQQQSSSPNHQTTLHIGPRRSGAASQGNRGYGESNLMSFQNCKSRPDKEGRMVADDGTVLARDDTVYLVCEPPGEPYYLGRIMEFIHSKNDPSRPVDSLRINWFYRPKDIGRKVQDTRAVFATMHSDTCPLTSLRGKCFIKHKSEIKSLDEHRKTRDCFWYEKLYDRYIQKNYEIIPTSQIVNVPERVKKVLDERWKFILIEQGRAKELTSAAKQCKRCSGYCASNDSVDCAVCQNTYHMNCVSPPLLKKPSRGFAWSCAACSRAQERKLEARHTPNVLDPNGDAEDEEYPEDEEEDAAGVDTGRTSSDDEGAHQPATAEQIYHASLWPWRYLGIHCKPEDALDYDDRIYPRASSRLGPRHQANVLPWPGRPVEYVKPLEIRKLGRRDARLSKEVQAQIEADRVARESRPKWVQDEPQSYVPRGGDYDNDDPNNTAQLLYRPVEEVTAEVSNADIDEYMDRARGMSASLGLPKESTNLHDVAVNVLFKNDFDAARALRDLSRVDRAEFKEPELNAGEKKKFEEGVAKYGSELHQVMKHVRSIAPATTVRYYYTWKKTDDGKRIWGNYSGRKGKKEAKKAEALASKLQDDVADDHDDSSFDAEKAAEKNRGFVCKFCSTKSSRQWRRAPNATSALVSENGSKSTGKDKNNQYVVALCRRCAELWRRYAIQWEDIDEVAKKVAQAGGRAWKKRVDEELLKELQTANEMMNKTVYSSPDDAPAPAAVPPPPPSVSQEPPRKKLKGAPDKELEQTASDSGSMSGLVQTKKKDKPAEKPAEKPAAPPAPEIPKPRLLPCAVCQQLEPLGDQHLSCRECRLTVHRNCYGIIDNRSPGKWVCDMCTNDKSPQVSIHYKCVLCPVKDREYDFVEPPKAMHKKRNEKDRERERIERENAQKAANYYQKRQEEMNKPIKPHEPLKRTADNNWVHVTCAVWTPEVKFGKAKALEPSEGIPSIPRARYAERCAACNQRGGACVSCHQCRVPVHVECAHQKGYMLGFDITPVKGSRRDQFNIVTINGESGAMVAAVWCKDHIPQKTRVHEMHEIIDETGLNALQLYVQNFKQADLTLTGCARKANLITLAAKMSNPTPASSTPASNRRASLTNGTSNGSPGHAAGGDDSDEALLQPQQPGGKICLTCGIDVSPKWHPIDKAQEREMLSVYDGALPAEAQKFVAQRNFQCHKCRKLKRQLKPRPVKREPSPPAEPVRLSPRGEASLASPPPNPILADPRSASRAAYSWAQSAHPAAVPPPRALTPTQVPPPVPASIPPVQAPPTVPPPLPPNLAAPRGAGPPPPPPHVYPPHGVPPANDWARPPSHHGPPLPHQHINGGPPPPMASSGGMPPLAPPNHLRPPPIGGMGHHPPPPPPPPTQGGHLSQPMVNGMPPSPRQMNGSHPPPPPPAIPGGGSYMHSPYHLTAHHPPHHLTNGGPPPRAPEYPFAQGMVPHRSPFAVPHGSPPVSRDGPPAPHPPGSSGSGSGHQPSESRSSGGASNSASLRNLLS